MNNSTTPPTPDASGWIVHDGKSIPATGDSLFDFETETMRFDVPWPARCINWSVVKRYRPHKSYDELHAEVAALASALREIAEHYTDTDLAAKHMSAIARRQLSGVGDSTKYVSIAANKEPT